MEEKKTCGIWIGDAISKEKTIALPSELPLALFLNGRHLITLNCSPAYIESFITGYLYTEQIIKKPEDIESIRIEKNRISILTTNLFSGTLPKKTILSGCGGSVSYINPASLPSIQSSFSISYSSISSLIPDLESDEEDLNYVSGFLVTEEMIVVSTKDISRHNVVDRLIGRAIRDTINPASCILFITGNISTEIVRKALVSSCPVLISTRTASSLSIDIAEKNGLTIGIHAGKKGCLLLSHPERIHP